MKRHDGACGGETWGRLKLSAAYSRGKKQGRHNALICSSASIKSVRGFIEDVKSAGLQWLYLLSVISTTLLISPPRSHTSRLLVGDQSKEYISSELKLVTCFGGLPSSD